MAYLKQYLHHIRCAFNRAVEANVLDTGSVNRSLSNPEDGSFIWMSLDPTPNVNIGIAVGTGDTPVTLDDVWLETFIANGSGAGQLVYGAQTINAVGGADPPLQLIITRTFTNNSGAQITIKEVVLVCQTRVADGTSRLFTLVREVLTTPVPIPNGEARVAALTLDITL